MGDENSSGRQATAGRVEGFIYMNRIRTGRSLKSSLLSKH